MMEDDTPDVSLLYKDVPVASCCDICDRNNSKLFLENKIVQLSETEAEILSYRTDHPNRSLCEIHYRNEVVLFSLNQKCCADPESRHKRKVKLNLLPVSLALARSCKQYTEARVFPQTKVCKNCHRYLTEMVDTTKPEVSKDTQP